MSIPILEACKKRKRKPKLYPFHSFADPGCPINPSGPFRDNIRLFLRECAEADDCNVGGMPTFCTLLIHKKNLLLPLYTVEESVKYSLRPFCDSCRCCGWRSNFVSKRKYHFIIPIDEDWNKPLGDDAFDIQTHLLHGLVHCNGFGHLLSVNGIEGGSRFLCGREIMDLWDRICTNLRVRKITVEDVSKKRAMDLRLLHGVAYGHPWFGRWGYRFSHGSFGVTEDNYDAAIEVLGSINLDVIVRDSGNANRSAWIAKIIRHYRNLSETQLITTRDLLRFMLTLKSLSSEHKAPSVVAAPAPRPRARTISRLPRERSGKCKQLASLIASLDSRWPARRLEYAAQVIVDALKEKKQSSSAHGGGMTRQEVRDAARLRIGDTGLLDYVLKSMNNVIVGGFAVRRAVNPSSRILEYTLHDLNDGESEEELVSEPELESDSALGVGSDVYSDVFHLYKNVLLGYHESEMVALAARAVLDSKHFVKEWPFRDEDDHLLRFICRLTDYSPGELIVLPPYATIGALKEAAQSAMRDTYFITEKIVVTEVENMEGTQDEEVLFGAVESGTEVRVRGIGIDLVTDLRYEGGADNWTVRCECGAEDDDGERMVACDICEIWQHTLCCGIDDAEAVPPLFVCPQCSVSLSQPIYRPGSGSGNYESSAAAALLLPQGRSLGTELLY